MDLCDNGVGSDISIARSSPPRDRSGKAGVGAPRSIAGDVTDSRKLTCARASSELKDARRAICAACGQTTEHAPSFRGLRRCLSCGFVSYPAGASDLGELYDDRYFAGGEYADYRGQEPALRQSMRRHLVQMSRYQRPTGSLLEVGCAYGFFLDEARRFFEPVMGIDIAEGPVSYGRDQLGLDTIVADFPALDSTRRFDAICMWDTLEHVPDADRFVAKAHELLAPNGHLFITTGDIGSLNARLRGARWRQIHPPTHVNYFSKRTLTLMLNRLGFDVKGMETASYYHTLYDVWAILELRGGLMGRAAGVARRITGPRIGNRLGIWVDLRDIIFAAAIRRD
jgi:SAM-dependent methyltransferase